MWQAKVLVQAVLARLPGGEAINHRLQRINARRRGPEVLANRVTDMARVMNRLKQLHPIKGATIVEVGTGWDALPTLCLSAEGAERVHTYDHVRHLRLDMAQTAAAVAAQARPEWGALWAARASNDLKSLLRTARVQYCAPGDASETGLKDASVDIFFSYAVLEHVPEQAASAIITEARRVLKPDGVFYALIGLHDHYHNFDSRVSKVNFLRYPEWLWSPLVKNRISYHNRLRERDFLEMLKALGAEIVDVHSTIDPDDLQRVRSMKIDRRFQGYSPEDLATTCTEIVCRFNPPGVVRPAASA